MTSPDKVNRESYSLPDYLNEYALGYYKEEKIRFSIVADK